MSKKKKKVVLGSRAVGLRLFEKELEWVSTKAASECRSVGSQVRWLIQQAMKEEEVKR